MRRIAVATDSVADLPGELAKAPRIGVILLLVAGWTRRRPE